MKLLATTLTESALERGLEVIESGYVAKFEMMPGKVTASVLREEPTGRDLVDIRFDEIAKDIWHLVASGMSQQSSRSVSNSPSRLPADLPEQLAANGQATWPQTLRCTCTCSESKGCRHIAAVGWIVADRLLTDPALLLHLRGIEPDEFETAQRQARVVRARGRAAAHPETLATGATPPPLESRIDDFWQCDPCIHELERLPAPNHASHALLRRLGPPTFKGRFPLLGLLASVYDTVSETTARERDRRDHVDAPDAAIDE